MHARLHKHHIAKVHTHTRTPRAHACTHISVSNTQTYKHTLYISRHTSPTTSEVVVAIAGMILPAINLLYTHNIV